MRRPQRPRSGFNKALLRISHRLLPPPPLRPLQSRPKTNDAWPLFGYTRAAEGSNSGLCPTLLLFLCNKCYTHRVRITSSQSSGMVTAFLEVATCNVSYALYSLTGLNDSCSSAKQLSKEKSHQNKRVVLTQCRTLVTILGISANKNTSSLTCVLSVVRPWHNLDEVHTRSDIGNALALRNRLWAYKTKHKREVELPSPDVARFFIHIQVRAPS